MPSPSAAAIFLLRLGTLPFVAAACAFAEVWMRGDDALLPIGMREPTRFLLVCHAAIILAFIGGLQQGAGLHASMSAATPLVVGGIAAALLGLAAIVGAHFGASRQAAVGLAVAYAAQAWLERGPLRPPPMSRPLMLPDARVAPMLTAVAALGLAALEGGAAKLLDRAALALAAAIHAPILTAHLRSSSAHARFGRVAVGTTNPCKLGAVRTALQTYPLVASHAAVQGVKGIASGVSEQPMTVEETATGARNRAEAAHKAHGGGPGVLALGVESGLFMVSGAHFDVCVVSAYDGTTHHLGLSCAFEIPPPILRHVLTGGLDLSQACNTAQITSDPKLGEHGGLISILSHGRVTRLDYTVQAVMMALFFAENPRWYS